MLPVEQFTLLLESNCVKTDVTFIEYAKQS